MGTRKPNLLWDALEKEYFPKGVPRTRAKMFGLVVATLRDQGGTPEEIPIRRKRLIALWKDQCDTCFSLVNNWQKLDHDPPAPPVGKVKRSSKKGWGK